MDYGLPHLTRVTWKISDTLDVAVTEKKTFENEFYKEGKVRLCLSGDNLMDIG